MADRQMYCVMVLSAMILGSECYLGYFIFVDDDREYIEMFNWMRLCIFFVQHLITLGMLVRLLFHEQGNDIIKWIFQLSLIILLTFISGEVFTVLNGGRICSSQLLLYQQPSVYKKQDAIMQFQINEITLYYQMMTDFAMFFVVSAIAMIVMKCKTMEEEQKYEFMIDNLKSEDFVDEPNAQEKKACAICLTDLQTQRVLKVPCDHFFHKQCLVNWLKRSTICPLCRTDIQQSLDPNSPLRSVGNAIPVSNPPQSQPIPELTFPQRPTVAIGMGVQSSRRGLSERVRSNDQGGLTERVVQQRSNMNSRVSYNQGTGVRNQPITRRENDQLPHSLPIINDNQIAQSTVVQQNNNQFTPRRCHLDSTRRFGGENTPRSIYLPSPESQKNINFRFKSACSPKSQPLIKVSNQGEEKKEQPIVSSLENITFHNPTSYPNPNQTFVQTRNYKYPSQTNNQKINNQMLRDQINA